MATRPYFLSFGASAVSGLSPTFIQFRAIDGSTLAPPSITEPGSFGMYLFSYDPVTMVAFICDGATSGLAFQNRYVQGVLDPSDQMGVTLVGIGNTAVALGLTNSALVGTTASDFGTDLSDPTTIFGFLKRAQETREGNETYTKSTGGLDIYSRGSSQLLASKTIGDNPTETTKT